MGERVSSKKMLSNLIDKLGLETFEKLAVDILEYSRSGRILLDVSLTRSLVGGETKLFEELSNKYKINVTYVRNAISALPYLLRTVITAKREDAIKRFAEDEKLSDKAPVLVEIGERLIRKYPEIRERFYITTFSKTNYIGEIDWEIVIKAIEPPIYEFEKKDRFPACILRFILEKPQPPTRPFFREERQREIVFEMSLSEIEKVIAIFTEIRSKMIEVCKELTEVR